MKSLSSKDISFKAIPGVKNPRRIEYLNSGESANSFKKIG